MAKDIEFIKPNKFLLLTDAMSPIIQKDGEDFLTEMKARGMKQLKTTEFSF